VEVLSGVDASGQTLPVTATINFSIISDHVNNFSNPSGLAVPAVTVQLNNTANFQRGLFAHNSQDTNVGAGAPAPAGNFGGLNTMLSAPSVGFVSLGSPNFDYHLTAGSPAIDQATGSTTTVDFEGKPRNSKPDIGASEFAATTPPPPTTTQDMGDNSHFVSGLYHDLLNRALDAGGQGFFETPLDQQRVALLGQVATEYVRSPENLGNEISGYYTKFLARQAGQGDITFWNNVLQSGSEEQVINIIVSSPEYFSDAGGTNSGWINKVYQDLLGRAPDPGSQGFLNGLNNGTLTRSAVAGIILASDEYRSDLLAQFYATFLGRQPGTGDAGFWKPVLAEVPQGAGNPSPDQTVLAGILGSQEYFQKNGETNSLWLTSLYTKLLHRNPDSGGFNTVLDGILSSYAAQRQSTTLVLDTSQEYRGLLITGYYLKFLGRQPSSGDTSFWTNVLAQGATDEQVITQIVASSEYFALAGGTNDTFLNKVYMDLLNRQRGSNETFFLQLLNNGTATRAQVVAAILTTQEYHQDLVNSFYTTLLGRQASNDELAFWNQVLNSGVRDEQVIALITASDEYFLRTHTFP